MSMVVKTYMRVDPGHKDTEVDIVLNNVCFFTEYRPPELKGKAMPGITVFVMNSGSPMACKVEVKTVRQLFSSIRN